MKSAILLLVCILFFGLPAAIAHNTGKRHSYHKRHHHKTTYYYDQRTNSYSTSSKRTYVRTSTPNDHRGNDGQKRNIQRNINYGSNQTLAPNNGNGGGKR